MVGLGAATALDEDACPVVVAAVAEPARPAPSSVPAMASEAPATASRGMVSRGIMELRMKDCLPLNAETVRPQDAAVFVGKKSTVSFVTYSTWVRAVECVP